MNHKRSNHEHQLSSIRLERSKWLFFMWSLWKELKRNMQLKTINDLAISIDCHPFAWKVPSDCLSCEGCEKEYKGNLQLMNHKRSFQNFSFAVKTPQMLRSWQTGRCSLAMLTRMILLTSTAKLTMADNGESCEVCNNEIASVSFFWLVAACRLLSLRCLWVCDETGELNEKAFHSKNLAFMRLGWNSWRSCITNELSMN